MLGYLKTWHSRKRFGVSQPVSDGGLLQYLLLLYPIRFRSRSRSRLLCVSVSRYCPQYRQTVWYSMCLLCFSSFLFSFCFEDRRTDCAVSRNSELYVVPVGTSTWQVINGHHALHCAQPLNATPLSLLERESRSNAFFTSKIVVVVVGLEGS